MKPDFSGWATKAGLVCSDGKTILAHAFKEQDGEKVPLVWQHQHNSTGNVLGHAILHNRDEGVRVDGFFNNTQAAQDMKEAIRHGDISALSIYANNLDMNRQGIVKHGVIREVSLVLTGANPGAFIDQVSVAHGDGTYVADEGIIYTGLSLEHADSDEDGDDMTGDDTKEEPKTAEEIWASMDDDQKILVGALIAQVQDTLTHSDESDESDEDSEDESDTDKSSEEDSKAEEDDSEDEDKDLKHSEEGNNMTRNIFEGNAGGSGPERKTLTHSQLQTIEADAQSLGSLKRAFIAHADEYGITNIDLLFPDAKALDNTPEFIKRRTEWVNKVLSGTKHVPYSRIKSLSADITHDEARAKGYIKGNLKKEEYFALAKRETTPFTVYKKQKLDRDDIIDVTDLDVVAWIKSEMRLMFEEEIARAFLIGDGREVDDEDKIDENKIRPIATDDDFYAHKVVVPANVSGETLIESIIRARPNYKGTSPSLFILEETLTDLMLLKDKLGRRLYNTEQELASALRVTEIITVPVFEGAKVKVGENTNDLLAILVNLSDYAVGTDRGGETSFFDDFDIDYNQYKYLYEARMSGALTKHKRALVITRQAGTQATPTAPTFVSATNTITIPSVTGVVYLIDGEAVTGSVVITEDTTVEADPAENYYFAPNIVTEWSFTYTLGG